MDKLRHLNDGVQLLVAQEGDNLPIPDEAPRLMRNYQDAPAVLSTSLWISNYGPTNITSGVLTWSLGGLAHNGTMVNVCNGSVPISTTIPQGPRGLMPLVPKLTCALPDLGESPPPPPARECRYAAE